MNDLLDENNDPMFYPMKRLWAEFDYIKRTNPKVIKNKDYQRVKFGNDRFNIPIWVFTMNWYDVHTNKNKIVFKIGGIVNIDDFMEEVDIRNSIMRNAIINMEEEDITKGRVF